MSLFNRLKTLLAKDEETKTYSEALTKTKDDFVFKLTSLIKRHEKVTDLFFEELEELLILADIGLNTVTKFINRLKARVRSEKVINSSAIKEIIIDELLVIYINNEIIINKLNTNKQGPTIILFVGVNGTGKTTTIGKLAYHLKSDGKKVLLVAGDTFRAGAFEQLAEWGQKVGVAIFGKKESKDPASVIYEAITLAKEETYDFVLIDTAGRLQNKLNLMQELGKINKVICNLIPNAPHETLLVIDATTGQNGISQAKAFTDICHITGIVLTKLDGTAKGGIILAIKEELNILVKYVGLGEKMTDLKVFDIEKYIYGLFQDMM